MRSVLLFALVFVLGVPLVSLAQSPSTHNESYLDPELDIERMKSRFETESREVFALREEIVEALGIEAGEMVADVGAGTGAFLDLLAGAVGAEGWVYAVEISPAFVQHLRTRATDEGYDNVTVVLSAYESATLPPASVDLVFTCDTYHHFDDHEAMLASIHSALRPGGEFVVVDFDRVEGVSRQWILDHVRASQEQFTAEILASGFELVEEVRLEGMVDNFYLRFRRP